MTILEVKRIIGSIYEEHYNMHRKGAYDFTDKDEWIKDKVERHEDNYPELYGYIWDEDKGDWIKKEKDE